MLYGRPRYNQDAYTLIFRTIKQTIRAACKHIIIRSYNNNNNSDMLLLYVIRIICIDVQYHSIIYNIVIYEIFIARASLQVLKYLYIRSRTYSIIGFIRIVLSRHVQTKKRLLRIKKSQLECHDQYILSTRQVPTIYYIICVQDDSPSMIIHILQILSIIVKLFKTQILFYKG